MSEPAVLFPTTDTALLTLSKLLDELEGYVTSLPTRELIETMVVKSRFYASLRQWGIPHPQTVYPDSDSWPTMMQQLSFPLFLRPVQSLPFAKMFRRKGFIAHNRQDIKTYLHLAETTGHQLMLQEIIPGHTTNEYVLRGFLDKQSQPAILMANQRVRRLGLLPPNAVKKSIPLAQVAEFAEIILTYLQKIRYTGLFTAEFKQDPRDGQFKLFEINARSGGSNDLARVCGVNHVLAAYREALGETPRVRSEYDADVYQIQLKVDLYQHVWRILHGQSISTMVAPYRGKKCWLIFSKDDPVPFIVDILTSIL
jgi:predicted ATP-grasp superfamily ATP-dependent carboligase